MNAERKLVRAGRPRSKESKAAILDATWELLKTTHVRDLSIEAIAKAAGVGKTTIYRWWSSKAAVVVDAFLEKVSPEIASIEANTVQAAFTKHFAAVVGVFSADSGRIVAEILAEGQTCPVALEVFRDRFLLPRRNAAKLLIAKGIQTGELDPALDPEIAIDILYGSIYYRLMVQHLPLNAEFGNAIPERALRCFLAQSC